MFVYDPVVKTICLINSGPVPLPNPTETTRFAHSEANHPNA